MTGNTCKYPDGAFSLLSSLFSNQYRCSLFSWAGITSSVLSILLSWMLASGYAAPATHWKEQRFVTLQRLFMPPESHFLSPIKLGHTSYVFVKIITGKMQCLTHISHQQNAGCPRLFPRQSCGWFSHLSRQLFIISFHGKPCQGFVLHVRNVFHSYTFYADDLLGMLLAVGSPSKTLLCS